MSAELSISVVPPVKGHDTVQIVLQGFQDSGDRSPLWLMCVEILHKQSEYFDWL